MQPVQDDLRDPAAKDNSITHTAKAGSNLDAATTMRSAETAMSCMACKRTMRNGVGNCSSKTGSRRQSEKKTILKHFLKGFLEGKSLAPKWRKSADKSLSQPSCSHSNTIYEVQLQKTIVLRIQPKQEATLTQPLQCELQNTIELRATASEIVASKPDLDARAKKRRFWSTFLKGFLEGKSLAPKWRKKALRARLPSKLHRQLIHQHHLQSHLHCGNDPTVANHNGILSTAHARKTLETPFTMRNRSDHDPGMIRSHTRPSRTRRTAEVDHRRSRTDFVWKNIGFRASAISQKRISCETSFKTPSATHPPAPLAIPFTLAGTILQLQITMEFCRPHMHEKHLKPHLQWGTDPTMVREWSDHGPRMIRPHTRPSRTRRTAQVDHRRSGTHFVWKNTGFRASAISQKRISCETSFKTPSATHPPAPLAIPFTLRERCYSCKSQWKFCRPHMHEKHLKPHLQCGTDPTMVREWSDHGPRMIRPHTRPSRTRRTAQVDHRRSGTHFVWKNTGFRASAISHKRISCETSFKTPSATHPPAPLAIPFTLRERSYSCKSMEFCRPHMHEKHLKPHLQCGTDPTMVREWSDHGPRMIRPHTRPSRTRRTAEVDHRRSGTHFVWKNTGFRASAISQKRISCETSFKTPSATHPPAPLAIPFTLREQFLWLTRSLTNSFFANSFFALSLTNSFFANSFFDYLIYPD